MENDAILARVPSALRLSRRIAPLLNHRALRDTTISILHSQFSIIKPFRCIFAIKNPSVL